MNGRALPLCARLPHPVDLPGLLQALVRIDGDAWQPHFNRGYYEGDWSGVALVVAEDAPLPLAPGLGAPVRCGWWRGEAAWEGLLDSFQAGVRAARLLRLGPGAQIHEHCDPDLGQPDGCLRLHVPLLSPPGVEFLVEGLQVPMQPGECWFVDLSRAHRVDNPTAQERIHLVLDCDPAPWLLALIQQGLVQTPVLQQGKAERAFAAFREHVLGDPMLAAHLQGLNDSRAFQRESRRLGAQLGFEFTEALVSAAMRRGRQAWNDQWRT
ncbi:aspartyl/asparaginyl beta-hydroxylase domain-containing protein [Pseudomonas putida]|uniref:aspartyl/asparaginyl beta-hydroxylase domain-containing protein n=1 Tax=Pseudomonas putida TaxID=303 RepID=UPI001C250C18|nr:aspartyl/asparaginyl beta-hydroxylase domain-containing protein [Pseudomonas putida]